MAVHAVTVVVATLVVVMGTKAALAQPSCSFNSPVAAQKKFNVNDLTGTWYTVYSSESYSVVSNFKVIKTILREVNEGGRSYIQSDRQVVNTNNKCTDSGVVKYELNADQGYIAVKGVTDIADVWDNHIYVLGLTSNVLVTYSNLKKNGVDESNVLFVMAKNPTASVTLTSAMESNLNALCGGTAASSLSSYRTVNADASAVCTT